MTALEMKVNALVLIAVGTDEERKAGMQVLQDFRDGRITGPVVEDAAADLLIELGFPEGQLGFEQARMALALGYRQPRMFDSLSGELYKAIQEACNQKPSKIDRNIRTEIMAMYRDGNQRMLEEFFRGSVSVKTGYPPTGAFLRRCLRELRSRMEVAVC